MSADWRPMERGDQVVCVDAGVMSGTLVEGQVYTVTSGTDYSHGIIRLEGVTSYQYAHRFEHYVPTSPSPDLENRLRLIYAIGLRLQEHRDGARIEVRVSSDMPNKLKAYFEDMHSKRLVPEFGDPSRPPTVWGFPIIPDDRLPEDTIQVLSVTTIH